MEATFHHTPHRTPQDAVEDILMHVLMEHTEGQMLDRVRQRLRGSGRLQEIVPPVGQHIYLLEWISCVFAIECYWMHSLAKVCIGMRIKGQSVCKKRN